MGSYMGDVGSYLDRVNGVTSGTNTSKKTKTDKMSLDMTDFLTLMVTELTNQSIDQTADTSDMLNQMVMMQMVDALVNMTDASLMSYSASLVGKEVTVGQYDSDGNLEEIVGVVKGTGTYNGQQVIFLDNDKYYYLSEIMAVGRLPETPPETEKPDEGEGPGEVEKPGDGEGPGETEPPNETDPDYSGENGAPEETGT